MLERAGVRPERVVPIAAAYANLNNQTLHYANRGVTINEIHNVYEVPKPLRDQWAARSYHGDAQNNVRGVINRFLGHFDGNRPT